MKNQEWRNIRKQKKLKIFKRLNLWIQENPQPLFNQQLIHQPFQDLIK
jgi:hypothetical protein